MHALYSRLEGMKILERIEGFEGLRDFCFTEIHEGFTQRYTELGGVEMMGCGFWDEDLPFGEQINV